MLSTNISQTRLKRKINFSLQGLIVPLVLIIVIILGVIFHQKFLVIKDVSCQMGGNECPPGVVTVLDRTNGSSFLLLNQKDLRKEILATGLVDKVDFSFKLPGKLNITSDSPSLSFFVKTAFSKVTPSLDFLDSSTSAAPSIEIGYFVATTEGKTFQLLSTGTLNQSDSESNYFLISQTIPSKEYLTKVFAWLHSLATSSMKPDAIYFLSDMIILKQSEQPDLVMSFSANPTEIILALQRLSEAITIKKPIVIDFRYSHPILK